MIDYHIHSTCSFDGRDPIADFCGRAVEIGLREICFTEHMDFDTTDDGYGYYDHGAYGAAIGAARERLGDRLTIRRGIEVDFQPRFESAIRRWLEPLAADFDFVMGSVHYCGTDAVFLGGEKRFGHLPLARLYADYLRDSLACIETELFDGFAHLDYLRRQATGVFASVEPVGCEALFAEVLAAAVERGMSLDLNRKHDADGTPRLPVPTVATLREFVALGGRHVTVGSDAHEAANLGRGLRGGFDDAAAAGLEAIAVYDRRQRRLVPLGELADWKDPT